MKKQAIFLCAGVFFLVVSIPFFFFEKSSQSNGVRVRVGNAVFSVDIADTESSRERGLGGQAALCDMCGMLFLFDYSDTYGFWMKDMRFPIDILWIRDGRIVHIEHRVDFHDQQKVYRPDQSADRVLEIAAGSCEKWGIRVGDPVSF